MRSFCRAFQVGLVFSNLMKFVSDRFGLFQVVQYCKKVGLECVVTLM